MQLGTQLQEILARNPVDETRITREAREAELRLLSNQQRMHYSIVANFFSQAIASITSDIEVHKKAPNPVELGRPFTANDHAGRILKVSDWNPRYDIRSPLHEHHEHWVAFNEWAEGQALAVSLERVSYALDEYIVITAVPAREVEVCGQEAAVAGR